MCVCGGGGGKHWPWVNSEELHQLALLCKNTYSPCCSTYEDNRGAPI